MRLSCILLCLTLSLSLHSQNLPPLSRASEITVGTFPNGAPFYIAVNRESKGFADFALVRKNGAASDELRRALVSLPHFSGRKPYDFLAENGIGYGPDGYVFSRDGVEVLGFENVPIYRQEVQDSTLLLIFDAMAMSSDPQAVVISGDIDLAKIREKAELFSMIVAPLDSDVPVAGGEWKPRDKARSKLRQQFSDNVAGINLIYSTKRGDRESLNTVLPLVTRMYSTQMSIILDSRIREAFRRENMPLADVKFRYKDSSEDSEDERFVVSVYAPSSSLSKAVSLLGGVLGDFDREGASVDELLAAKGRLSAQRRVGGTSNGDYVRKCISSYLYGTDLASEATVEDFYHRSRLEDLRELELFNGFAQALLDPDRNLAIRYELPVAGMDSIGTMAAFHDGWEKGVAVPGERKAAEMSVPSTRLKIKSESADPVTGGSMWTFSNGLKLIFRKTAPKAEFSYAVILNGGSPSVPEIGKGESAFLSDMLSLCDIGGIPGRVFFDLLLSKGISMNVEAGMSTLKLSGRAPTDRFDTLLSAILTICNDRKVNEESFAYFRECEALREDMKALAPRDVNAIMDEMSCPGYKYSELKDISCLRDDFPYRAEQYFERQFSKMNDGVFVILGDFEADAIKKELTRCLGDFATRKVNTPRPNIDLPMIAGRTSRIDESGTGTLGAAEMGVNMELSALVPYNLVNFMSFRVALDYLRKELSGAMVGLGYRVELTGVEDTFPKERIRVYLSCRPCPTAGVPADVEVADQLSVLAVLRRFVEGIASRDIPSADLKALKAKLSSELAAGQQDNERLIELAAVRYGEGKDLATGAQAAVSSVSAESVRRILEALSEGSCAEYVIL